jgi:hypothetical protein
LLLLTAPGQTGSTGPDRLPWIATSRLTLSSKSRRAVENRCARMGQETDRFYPRIFKNGANRFGISSNWSLNHKRRWLRYAAILVRFHLPPKAPSLYCLPLRREPPYAAPSSSHIAFDQREIARLWSRSKSHGFARNECPLFRVQSKPTSSPPRRPPNAARRDQVEAYSWRSPLAARRCKRSRTRWLR